MTNSEISYRIKNRTDVLLEHWKDEDLTSLEFRNDPMFLRNHFMGEGAFEMPKIKKEEVEL